MKTHSILPITLGHGYDYSCLHFTPEETEAQKDTVTCPRSPSQQVVEQGFELRPSDCRLCNKLLHDAASHTIEGAQVVRRVRRWKRSRSSRISTPRATPEPVQIAVVLGVHTCKLCPPASVCAHGSVCRGGAGAGTQVDQGWVLGPLPIQSPRTSSTGVAWEPVRNAEPRPPHRPSESESAC